MTADGRQNEIWVKGARKGKKFNVLTPAHSSLLDKLSVGYWKKNKHSFGGK